MHVRELQPHEFTERLSPIFEAVLTEAKYPVKFKPDYFFPHWRHLMELGVASTWESYGKAVLGALFVPELFSGERQALCVFWFSLPEVRGRGIGKALFQALDEEAKKRNSYAVFASANVLNTDEREAGYLANGFTRVEALFRKVL